MIPRRQRVAVRDFPRSSKTLGFCAWLKIKAKNNNLGFNRYGVVFPGFKSSATHRNLLKRKTLAAARLLADKYQGSDYLLIISGQGPETIKKLRSDIGVIMNKK